MTLFIAAQASLFDAGETSSFEGAAGWTDSLLKGPLALSLCVLAVALVGFATLSGRLPIRLGARAVLGAFVLLGAPVIASALVWQNNEPSEQVVYSAEPTAPEPAREGLPPADYDPYSGASLRRE